ncbi:hypothetical protein PENTCL1PPCAC_4216, partial [Pristionchus entomophagus]
FYRIFFVQSILEVALLFQYLVGRILIKDRALSNEAIMSLNGGVIAEYYYHGTVYFFFHVQIWGVIVLSLIRFINICAPQSSLKQKLDSMPLVVCFLINTIVPFGMLFRLLLQEPISFDWDKEGNAAICTPQNVVHTNALQSTIVTSIGTMLSASFYAAALIKLTYTNHLTFRDSRREKGLILIGSVHFLSQCTMTAYYVIVTFGAAYSEMIVLVARNIYVLPVLMMTFTSAWTLTITHTRLRDR